MKCNANNSLEVVNGGIGLQAGFLVAFKQLVPEHSIVLFQGVVKAQVKYLVIPVLVLYTVVGAIIGCRTMMILPWTGFFTAWIYLRFYRISYVESLLPMSSSMTSGESTRTRIRGDASDTFALAKFFYPRVVADAVTAIADPIFSILVALKICMPFNEEEVEASNVHASLRTRGTPTDSSDSERRRALALKVLGDRLETQKGES